MCVIKNTIIQTNVSQKKVLKLFPSPYLLIMSDVYRCGLFLGLRNGIILLIVSALWNTDRLPRISTD